MMKETKIILGISIVTTAALVGATLRVKSNRGQLHQQIMHQLTSPMSEYAAIQLLMFIGQDPAQSPLYQAMKSQDLEQVMQAKHQLASLVTDKLLPLNPIHALKKPDESMLMKALPPPQASNIA